MIPKQPPKPKKQPKYKINKATKKQVTKAWKQKKLLCEEIDLAAATKEQMLYSIKHLEQLLQRQQETVEHHRKTITFQQKIIEDNKKGVATLIDKYEDHVEVVEKQFEECQKEKIKVTRAYVGLAKLGKFAEQQGIDLTTAKDELPESEKNKYDFSQKHTVLESGKPRHEIILTPKKNGKEPK